MKNLCLILFTILLFTGCSNDDSQRENNRANEYIGNKYAYILIETKEECEAEQEENLTQCAQLLEIINDSQVEIAFTDVIHRANFYLNDNKLIVESSSGIPEDLIFQILQNGDLKLGEENWIKYENSYYEQ